MNIDGVELRYWEGSVVSRDNRGTLVEWHDGSRERIMRPVDSSLSDFQRGAPFGAWVTLDGDSVQKIENAEPLTSRLRVGDYLASVSIVTLPGV